LTSFCRRRERVSSENNFHLIFCTAATNMWFTNLARQLKSLIAAHLHATLFSEQVLALVSSIIG